MAEFTKYLLEPGTNGKNASCAGKKKQLITEQGSIDGKISVCMIEEGKKNSAVPKNWFGCSYGNASRDTFTRGLFLRRIYSGFLWTRRLPELETNW